MNHDVDQLQRDNARLLSAYQQMRHARDHLTMQVRSLQQALEVAKSATVVITAFSAEQVARIRHAIGRDTQSNGVIAMPFFNRCGTPEYDREASHVMAAAKSGRRCGGHEQAISLADIDATQRVVSLAGLENYLSGQMSQSPIQVVPSHVPGRWWCIDGHHRLTILSFAGAVWVYVHVRHYEPTD